LGAAFYYLTQVLNNPNPGSFPPLPTSWPAVLGGSNALYLGGKGIFQVLDGTREFEIRHRRDVMMTLSLVCGYLICGLIGLIGIAVLWLIYDGTIDLSRLISEPNGDASMSRFLFLVFTFVISLSLFMVIVSGKDGKPAFPDTIPGGILTLLGISGSSYAVGKAIQFSDPAGIEDRPVTVTIAPTTAAVKYGQKQQFMATVTRKPDAKVKWEVTAGPTGANVARIDPGYRIVHCTDGAVRSTSPHATVKATLVDYPDVSDVAVVTFLA
jgi:hypothetical protein